MVTNTPYEVEVLPEVRCAIAEHIGFSPRLLAEEDHSTAILVNTAGGLILHIGILADSFGGAIGGKPAGQYIVEAVIAAIQASPKIDALEVLQDAIQSTHRSLQQAAQSNMRLRHTGATLTIAAVDPENLLLYLAHIGDNRLYLVRKAGGLQKPAIYQLTVDHTPEESQGGMPVRYIGMPAASLEIDTGIQEDSEAAEYLDTYEDGVLDLQPDDTLVLCSNGLTEINPTTGLPFTDPEEIALAVSRQSAEGAAETIINLALSRQVHDNVTALVMEMPGKRQRSSLLLPLGAAALLVIVLLIIGSLTVFRKPAGSTGGPSPTLTRRAITAQPSPDIRTGYAEIAAISSDSFGAYIPGWDSSALAMGDPIPFGSGVRVWTAASPAKLALSNGGGLYLEAETSVYLAEIGPSLTTLIIEQGSLLVIGNNLRIDTVGDLYGATCIDGVMGVHFDQPSASFQVDCLGGSCETSSASSQQALTAGNRAGYARLLALEPSLAQYDTWMLLGGLDVPRPTATPTLTPTNTATPTRTPTITPRPAATIPPPPAQGATATDRPEQPNPTATPDAGGG